ncbi:hypothetical protein [Caldisalinibacter kiritimatiensis]|uniref:DUF11 domain-containing protein n=1 Tax=Caldisalinibacter kiritimatiensis TaxID=1304284 RepID=R1CX65_9FIRM|nr:hypothetical protein [Caldisalinibacter kiritimatiensis]EOD01219.1 hypothetical protein L21TH_0758 [Caldisalinibacter kiritimatiensis]
MRVVEFCNELIRIENDGGSPINNTIMTDTILLDNIDSITVLDICQGSVSITANTITWDIGDLAQGVSNVAVLQAEITGSFSTIGNKVLDEANVQGNSKGGPLTDGPATGQGITVQQEFAEPILTNNKTLIDGPTTIPVNEFSTWEFTVEISNAGTGIIQDVIATDLILLNIITEIVEVSLSKGSVSFSSDQITWDIGDLALGETVTGIFKVVGAFTAPCDQQPLNRTFAVGFDPVTNQFVETGIESGATINVLSPIEPFKSECIITDKVYAHCQQRECFTDVEVNLGNNQLQDIKFKQGVIVENTLVITDILNKPNFKRVQFVLTIPYEVILTNGEKIEGVLPDISKDIVLFIPDSRDEFDFRIVVETASKVLEEQVQNDILTFAAGVFIIIKVVGKVQLLIPSFGFCVDPPLCEEFTPRDICKEFDYASFPDFYPEQYE